MSIVFEGGLIGIINFIVLLYIGVFFEVVYSVFGRWVMFVVMIFVILIWWVWCS